MLKGKRGICFLSGEVFTEPNSHQRISILGNGLNGCGKSPLQYSWPVTVYCFDIDGTICATPEDNYYLSTPIYERIDIVNKLFQDGHEIIFFTARGAVTGLHWQKLTESQLKEWGVLYHKLIMGKPHADIFIDDKAMSDSAFFSGVQLK